MATTSTGTATIQARGRRAEPSESSVPGALGLRLVATPVRSVETAVAAVTAPAPARAAGTDVSVVSRAASGVRVPSGHHPPVINHRERTCSIATPRAAVLHRLFGVMRTFGPTEIGPYLGRDPA
jgi:hypothetical protein